MMISKALSASLFFWLCIQAAACESSEPDDDDVDFAVALFDGAGLDVERSHIERVLRDRTETVVWVRSTFEGLPVFFHNTGYVFDANGQPAKEPAGDRPLRLGPPLPDRGAFPLDHTPDIEQTQAFERYRQRAASESRPFSSDPDEDLGAMLGFYDVNLGKGKPPTYRLVWRVTPIGAEVPEAIVSAKKGDLLYFDSGIRTMGPINPGRIAPDVEPDQDQRVSKPDQEPFTGTWYSPRCDERDYTRRLVLEEDNTFAANDLVAPCPKDARCYWSGIVTRSGTWRLDRGKVELSGTSESRPGVGAPLAGLLDWFPAEDKLVEVIVGGPMTCEYRRERPEQTGGDSAGRTCSEAVQGRIAWNYEGSRKWATRNLDSLCAGAERSTEPATCFEETMHGGLPGKSNTEWHWRDALRLCAGTTDAQQTIGCYRAEYHSGSPWNAAVEACRPANAQRADI